MFWGMRKAIDDTHGEIKAFQLRHSKKEKVPSGTPDSEVPLSPEWIELAREMWKKKWINPDAKAYNSPRLRTYHTIWSLVGSEGITSKTTRDEIMNVLKEGGRSAIRSDYREPLDFYFGEDYDEKGEKRDEYKKALDSCYEAANNWVYMDFLCNESDDALRKLKDPKISSYTKCAGDMAEILLRYYWLKDRRSKYIENKKKKLWFKLKILRSKYIKKDDRNLWEIQRLFCTHAWVAEPFLLRVVEKLEGNGDAKKGREAVKKFIEDNNIKNGFSYCDGLEISFTGSDAVLKFNGKEFKLSEELLKWLVKDRDSLYDDIGVKKDDKGQWILGPEKVKK